MCEPNKPKSRCQTPIILLLETKCGKKNSNLKKKKFGYIFHEKINIAPKFILLFTWEVAAFKRELPWGIIITHDPFFTHH